MSNRSIKERSTGNSWRLSYRNLREAVKRVNITRLITGLVTGLLVVMAMAWAPTTGVAIASADSASIKLNLVAGPPTEAVKVTASDFGASETVDITFDSTAVASGTTNSSGALSVTFAVPTSAVPGTHTVTASGQSSGLVASRAFLVRTNWAEFHFDATSSGHNPYENVLGVSTVVNLKRLWRFPTTSSVQSSPAVVDGVLYVGSNNNKVYAVSALTGVVKWSFTAEGAVYSSPAVVGGVVYIGSFDGNVYALDAATGAEKWMYSTGTRIQSSPVVSNGVVYIGNNSQGLFALTAASGHELWSFAGGGAVLTTPAVANGVVYVASWGHGLYALKASTGATIWNADVGCCETGSSPAVANGVVYIGQDISGDVDALNASTGAKLWTFSTGGNGNVHSSPAVADGMVYVGSDSDSVVALNVSTGAEVWGYETGGFVESSPAVADGVAYIGSADGNLYALNASNGVRLWSYPTGGQVQSSPAVANGTVYVGSDNPTQSVIAFSTTPINRVITRVVTTGDTKSPIVTVSGHGFGIEPPAAYSANHTSCGDYVDNGDWFGVNGLNFTDVGNFGAGAGTASGGSCVGLILMSWSNTKVRFEFGSAYDSFDHWYVSAGDQYVVTVRKTNFPGVVSFSPSP